MNTTKSFSFELTDSQLLEVGDSIENAREEFASYVIVCQLIVPDYNNDLTKPKIKGRLVQGDIAHDLQSNVNRCLKNQNELNGNELDLLI